MKKIYLILALCVAMSLAGCQNLFNEGFEDKVYDDVLTTMKVILETDGDYSDIDYSTLRIQFTDMNNGNNYRTNPKPSGDVSIEIPYGVYRIMASGRVADQGGFRNFNGIEENVRVVKDGSSAKIDLASSLAGSIIIKEIYSGGCYAPNASSSNWFYDRYVILYNNTNTVQYLDGICFGTLDPSTSNSLNVWNLNEKGEFEQKNECYMGTAVWRFPGTGQDFPLQAGEQAVLVINGAIDHSAIYENSVNLNKPDYFVTYNSVEFPEDRAGNNHPTPGDQISSSRYLELLRKLNTGASAFVISNMSPAVAIFKGTGEAEDMGQYVALDKNVVIKESALSTGLYAKIAFDWILDGVEVYRGDHSANYKRFHPSVDAGFVVLQETYQGYTIYRNVDAEETLAVPDNTDKIVYNYTLGDDPSGIDAEASIKNGARIIYKDTNNSSEDFHMRRKQSLHDSAPINQ